MAGALVCIGALLAVVTMDKGVHFRHLSSVGFAVGLVVVGVVLHFAARAMERPLDGSSESSLVRSYQARMFIWVGLGEFPAFLSVTFVVLTGQPWLYLIGLAFALAGLARIAPTAAHLAKDQQELRRRGSTLSLTQVLSPMPSRRRFL